MTEALPYALPVLYTIFAWWFSTGVILWLNRLPKHTYRWSLMVATGVLGVAIVGLVIGSEDTSLAGAYHGFTAGLVIWGWHEMAFLMGFVTGPRTEPQSTDARGWKRFAEACATIAYHEAAIAVTAVLMVLLTWDAPNQIGTLTFLAFWGLRLSAKLNVYFGVPNFTDEFLPDHLAYLRTYFPPRSMNWLFPISVSAGTVAVVMILGAAWAPTADGLTSAGLTCLASLVALAVLEHWFLVLPLRDAALWQWAFDTEGARKAKQATAAGDGLAREGLTAFKTRPAPAASSP